MNHLLCRLGIHRPAWQAVHGPTSWLQIRVCARCRHPLERPHR